MSRRAWWRTGVGLAWAGLAGCAFGDSESASLDQLMDEEAPAGACMGDASEGGSSGQGCGRADAREDPANDREPGPPVPVDACGSSAACEAGVCAAVFVEERREAFECRPACVANDDEASWCADDEACCDPDARCGRGYCSL